MEYWWEGSTSTAILTTSASDVVEHCNNIRGIALGAALVYINQYIDVSFMLEFSALCELITVLFILNRDIKEKKCAWL